MSGLLSSLGTHTKKRSFFRTDRITSCSLSQHHCRRLQREKQLNSAIQILKRMRLSAGELGSGQTTNFYVTVITTGMTHLKLRKLHMWRLNFKSHREWLIIHIVKWLIPYKRIYYLSLKRIFPSCIWVPVCSFFFGFAFFLNFIRIFCGAVS